MRFSTNSIATFKKNMKNIINYLLVFLFLIFSLGKQEIAYAQSERIANADSFGVVMDSLFTAQKYKSINSICQDTSVQKEFPAIAGIYLIVTYFMLGDTVKSNQLLYKRISNYSDSSQPIADAVFMVGLHSDLLGWLYYRNIPENGRKIDSIIISVYKMENVSEPQYGLQLLNFLITDQVSRDYFTYLHPWEDNKEKPSIILKQQWMSLVALGDTQKRPSMFPIDSASLRKIMKENASQVYKLYKESGRVFSQKEVGSIDFAQYLMFAHDGDSVHRKYYLQLIKNGVKDKVCNASRIISFILRTEYSESKDKKEYFKTLPARMDSLKKEYNVADYSFSPF